MGLRLRFNLILTAVFLPGLLIAGWVSYDLLQRNARDEVIRNAELMMAAARAIRGYTVDEVRPLIADEMSETFLPQSVPAYAAHQTLGALPDEYRDFVYKEATLNPTNPRDRAVAWEADLIQAFDRDDGASSLSGVRSTPGGPALYIASPIRITNQGCLVCHSLPSVAPASMIELYGDDNGFGWQLDEVVGAQIVSVPMSVAGERADRTFAIFMLSLCAIFVLSYLVLNVALTRLIVRPISDMARAADRVSTGDFAVPEFAEGRKDEVGGLAVAFNRMRRSLEQAMRMIED
jgi:HAMP domain-containing protein